MKRKLFYAPLSIVVSVAAMMFAPVANAQQDHQLASPSQEKHCAVRIDPVKPGQTSSTMGKPRCFGTFAEAIYAATNGTVRLPAGAHILTQSEATASTTRTVLSIDFAGSYQGGNSFTWYTDNTAGCYGLSYFTGSMPSGWNDVVSSSTAYAGCYHNPHYEHINYGGAIEPCGCSPILHAMDNQTSSEKWNHGGFPI